MEFREKQAIYLQIAEYVCEQILRKQWQLGSKIMSIRDLAVIMEVNPNTVQRAYDFLQQRDIITNKRGIGYFIEENAIDRVISFKKEQFIENELPVFFRSIYLLKMPLDDLKARYEGFIDQHFKENNHEK
ncbi:MAG: GntR family transcriptional regulator [Mucilaginibacter sp.]|jgi:DNA-binding transcriptional regulator YhcF (GntR family)|nr:GntR family transcriptional regulator [Mucilaginibacter sp.]